LVLILLVWSQIEFCQSVADFGVVRPVLVPSLKLLAKLQLTVSAPVHQFNEGIVQVW